MAQLSLTDLTIDEAVRTHATTRPDDIAVVDPRATLTWSALDAAAHKVTRFLRDQGVRPGDRVGWLGPNSVHYPAVLLGTWRLGAAIVGMNWRLPEGELARAAQAVDLAHVVADFRFAEVAGNVLAGRTSIAGPNAAPWDDLDATALDTVVEDDSDDAMIYFTSGSTGTPKAVPLTRGAVEATIVHADVHHFTSESRALIIPPAFHVAGATWTNYGLKHGVSLVYTDDASPAGLVDALRTHRITHTIMVPTLIHALVLELRRNPQPLPDLEHVGYGASPITSALLEEALERLDCEFSQVYGMTEAGGGVTFLLTEDHAADPAYRHRLGSAGRPGTDVELDVRDSKGAPVPTGESGELWFRTPCLTRGYIGIDDPSGGVLVDGWLNTHDVGYQDADGYVYVQGRSDDMIQTGGENVHPRAVEEILSQHPGVADCAVYGTPHEHWGEQVCAAVVPASDGVTEQDLIAHCAARLAGYQVPKKLLILTELPRTATGKVLRKNLAEQTLANG